jgi:hypothetical protein
MMAAAVGDSIRSTIGKPKRKSPIERPMEKKEGSVDKIDSRACDQPICGLNLLRVVRLLAEVMETSSRVAQCEGYAAAR